MLELSIPGFGTIRAQHLVCDFTGTLSVDGRLLPGVRQRLNRLAEELTLHIVTGDAFGTAAVALKEVRGSVLILDGEDQDWQKEWYVRDLGAERVIAVGNGNNDWRMLKAARLGIAVSTGEGCAVATMLHADIQAGGILEALDLLLHPQRLRATLRT
jgi:P-type E1-E2 ATPase